jgi:tRNA U34 5-methylaminomethyl-2-thiouridine-forming methyltransferase MnmC
VSKHIKIITTRDGSNSLINTELNETYHSIHGAVQESNYVFIKNGLELVLERKSDTIHVLEVGFGTGLNALLTLQAAIDSQRKISYTSIDNLPLPKEIWAELNYVHDQSMKNFFEKIHTTPWNEMHAVDDWFDINKVLDTVQFADFNDNYFDIVYFDAFAPNKQPEMWEEPILKKIYSSLRHRGAFVTYCAKGQVKRDLGSIGFAVETLQGPPGKKEMIRASKL